MVIEIPEQVNRAIKILSDNGYDAYVVGGAVRNVLLGRKADDWDVAASSLPEETEKALSDYTVVETGIQHGTVTAVIDGMHIEITTFRVDGEYSDHRHPDSVKFADRVEDDLSRRDFTCNAMAYNHERGLVDPFGGEEDIKRKVIRCVGNPDTRFNEDGLRIMRALRFACVLGFEIDAATSESIHRNVCLLDDIAVERIYVELIKMMPFATADFLMEYEDVFFRIMPVLGRMKGCRQNHPRHIYDVWEHSCRTVENMPGDGELRLAALLHDSGKPLCRTTDENGTDHFRGHAELGEETARYILNGLKVSNETKKNILNLIRYHEFLPECVTPAEYRRYTGIFGKTFIYNLYTLRRADVSAQNPVYAEKSLESLDRGLAEYEKILSESDCFSLADLKIDGRDLIAMGVEPGEKIRHILDGMLDRVLEDRLPNDRKILLSKAKEMLEIGNS